MYKPDHLSCLLVGTVTIALSGAPLVYAQQEVLDEIVITAQKRSESLQDVPIAVSAFSDDFIASSGVSTLTALIDYTPGLTGNTTGYSNPAWGIRGAVTNDAFAGSENSVGVFQDEAYIGRDQLASAAFLDIERIEVVKGPQGTLFGRNAVSGAINIVTNKPARENSLKLHGGVGNEGQQKFGAVGNLVAKENFLLRAALQTYGFDGIDTNVVNGKKREIDELLGRIMAHWTPSDDLDLLLTVQVSENENNLQRYHNPDLTNAFGLTVGTEPFDTQIAQEGLNREDVSTRGVDLRVTWQVSDSVALTSISDWRDFDHDYSQDLDGINFDFGPVLGFGAGMGGVNFAFYPGAETWAQEFRLNGSQDKFGWFVGMSYFQEEIAEDSLLFSDGFGVDVADKTITEGDTKSHAVYGDVTYQASDRLTLTAGLRYTRDEKSWCTENVAGFAGFFGDTGGTTLCRTDDWTDIAPRLVMDYSPSDALLLYASWSRGYKAGGFNAQAEDTDVPPNGTAETVRAFDPEEIEAFEIGLKSMWMDGRLKANVSAYQNDYTDLQVETIQNAQVLIDNAAKADIQGAELELTWLPGIDGLQLNFSYALIDGEYDGIIQGVDVSGNRLLQTPEHSYNISVMHEWESGHGLVSFFLAYNWVDEQFFDAFETALLAEDDYGIWNGSVRYTHHSGRWDVALLGENLADEEYSLLNQDPIGFGVRHFIRGYPRLVRAEFSYHF